MTTADRRYGGRTVVARKAERRQRFLEAATRIFAERGYATCSLAEVCAAAGLSKRQFYEEFETREDVLLAAYDRIQDDAATAVATSLVALTKPTDPETALRAGFAAYLESLGSDPYRAQVALIEVVGVSDRMEDRRRARRHAWAALIDTALEGIGVRLRGGDAQLTTALITGAVNGMAHEWLLRESRPPVGELVELLTGAALSLILTD
ncbi:TetR/AcrR family transcriptional regulator [Nocardia sp. AG03]|uniref:TetR/AcrR family transcriptional regulator n=1 Tax=Nocardia sp. AG03 TaxID=3025312 RepID=UPI002418B9D3|nr:TetR/AcrR family transcriptional regulator [Nocardia sp. AG03]